MMKSFKLIALTILTLLPLAMSAQTKKTLSADAILKKCSETLVANKCTKIDFVIKGLNGDFSGTLTLQRDKFTMNAPGLRVWFDGKTQWTLIEEQKSVSITEPEEEDLLQTNPLAILLNYNKIYSARRINGAQTGSYRIELMPKMSKYAEIKKVDLDISEKTWMPTQVEVTFFNGSRLKANVTKVQAIAPPVSSFFQFNAKDFPKIEIVDLR